jgi:hypothetical protein
MYLFSSSMEPKFLFHDVTKIWHDFNAVLGHGNCKTLHTGSITVIDLICKKEKVIDMEILLVACYPVSFLDIEFSDRIVRAQLISKTVASVSINKHEPFQSIPSPLLHQTIFHWCYSTSKLSLCDPSDRCLPNRSQSMSIGRQILYISY